MSFHSRDLMIDVLPAGKPFAHPGLDLCGQATREEGDEEDCGQATREETTAVDQRELELGVLRRQLRRALVEGRV